MRIEARYSHLNGEEYLLVHRGRLWEEVREVIEGYIEVLREEGESIHRSRMSGLPPPCRD